MVQLGFQEIEQVVRSRQAADVRGLNAVGVILDAHDLPPGPSTRRNSTPSHPQVAPAGDGGGL
jgi:hypothetical protein